MEPAMKQRLLGAAVIVGLAVIILPLLLDGSGTSEIENIPPPPQPETAQTGPIVGDDRVPLPPPAAEPAPPAAPPPDPQPAAPEPGTPPAPSGAAAPSPSVEEPVIMERKAQAPAPSAPSADTAPEAEQTAPPAPAPEAERATAPTPAPAPESSPEPPAPAAEARPAPDHAGWVVQVGSFSGRDKAEALSQRLAAAGFEGFTDSFTADGKTMYRVRVGPLPDREQAESMQARIKAEQQLEGYVTQQR